MKITIAKSEKEFDCIAAWQIIGEILNKPEAVIGLRQDVRPEICTGWLEKYIPVILSIPLRSRFSDWMKW